MAEGRWLDREQIAKMRMHAVATDADETEVAMVRGWNEAVDKIVEELSGSEWPVLNRVATWVISSDGYYPYCSHCHYEPPCGQRLTKFCPECGARMIGK